MERFFEAISDMSPGARTALLATILLAMAGFYYFVPYSSYERDLAKARRLARLAQQRLRNEKQRQAQILKDEEKMKELRQKIKELAKRLPSTVGMNELIGELDRMSEEMSGNLRVKSIRPLPEDTETIPMVVIKPIELKVEGRFHAICRFLYKMFQMNRLMDVGDIEMHVLKTSTKDNSKVSPIEAKFTARIYYAPLTMPSGNKKDQGPGGPDLMKTGMKRITNPEGGAP